MRRKVVFVTLAVIGVALLVAGLLVPHYVTTLREARELTRRQNLFAMRTLIKQYTLDKQKRPDSLDDLIRAGYLKYVLVDPMTGRKDTWIVECSNDPAAPGIVSINSGDSSATSQGLSHCD